MANEFVPLLLLTGALFYLAHYLTRGPKVYPIIKEDRDATVEICSHCYSIIGTVLKGSATWRIIKRDTCPNCNVKIKR